MALTLDELLNSLKNPAEFNGKLENTAATWARIGSKDSFTELGMEKTELNDFLTEWAKDNPYSNI
jgi:hypothetical protein